ncbi:DUF342 domain-containing protein [Spirochaeta africana]|uniref:Putative polymerase with PALM domain, HD hydrolase domain and Zn ribbon n=1 Tax=Spirochaeta africana (strain ATCC 700263 / DSM 8902 / Z-7692) TaxID=889378 RepID=H9ULE6_SPIAZ|nr:FapA family protein [Spirochaeta africana]AFG38339.1 putative polymerase with PALM domain, HD hydrolase domain and Zn ribbon [Spirochaeta africana DSM 8902]
MKDLKDYNLESFSESSEELLKEIAALETSIEHQQQFNQYASQEAYSRFQQLEELGIHVPTNGYVSLHVADDLMTAHADFHPGSEGMQPVSLDQVTADLNHHQISHGILWDAIHEAIQSCNLEQTDLQQVLIAEGQAPVMAVSEHIVVDAPIPDAPKVAKAGTATDERIDYHKVHAFVLVEPGQQLARRIPAVPGAPGINLRGEEVPFRSRKEPSLRIGSNITELDGVFSAACQGRLEIADGEIRVNEVLVLHTDVDYHTGHIDYPKDVMIKGLVRDSFHIKAGGSVFCSKTLDATEVTCGGDLFVQLGIIGRKQARICAGGAIRSKFIENCYIEATGDVQVASGILHSSINTTGAVLCGKRGIVVGGSIQAQNGVQVYQLGSQMAPKTEVYCGTDFNAAHKLELVKDKTMQLALNLQKVNQQLKQATPQQQLLLQQLRDKLMKALTQMNDQASSLVFNLDRNENSVIDVLGTVYPGVYIEICHVSYIVQRPLNRVRFSLNKAEGRIQIDPLRR